MFGFLIFYNVYLNLSCEGRNKILGNVFNLNVVSVSEFIVEDDRIFIRMFGKDVFYRYLFIFEEGQSEVIYDNRIVKGKIFAFDKSCKDFNEFLYLLGQCFYENEVYYLIK